jgi:hypothetical protein
MTQHTHLQIEFEFAQRQASAKGGPFAQGSAAGLGEGGPFAQGSARRGSALALSHDARAARRDTPESPESRSARVREALQR